MNSQLIPAYRDFLFNMISSHKRELFNQIIQNRTRFLTVVVEDVFQSHNASAVLRSCDCFGIQDVHVIEGRNRFDANGEIVLGADQWLTIHRYGDAPDECFTKLRAANYQIIGTSPEKGNISLHDFRPERPTALVFGTEKSGMSSKAMSACDGFVTIPMVGFTESLNISVSAAICMQYITAYLRKYDLPWRLSPEEQDLILTQWAEKVIGNDRSLQKEFLRIHEKNHY